MSNHNRHNTKLHCYGENSFTFLIFQAFSKSNRISQYMLPNLKSINTGSPIDKVPEGNADVYLFPNFGKSNGFGEPDALVLIENHSFWFEIETRIDPNRSLASFDGPLLQLYRFYMIAHAIENGPVKRKGKKADLAYVGGTLTNDLKPRPATLLLAKHTVVRDVRNRVHESVIKKNDHYVLFLDEVPSGISKKPTKKRFGDKMQEFHNTLSPWCRENGMDVPSPPPIDRFWYLYWKGEDLRKKYVDNDKNPDPLKGIYIPTKSSQK